MELSQMLEGEICTPSLITFFAKCANLYHQFTCFDFRAMFDEQDLIESNLAGAGPAPLLNGALSDASSSASNANDNEEEDEDDDDDMQLLDEALARHESGEASGSGGSDLEQEDEQEADEFAFDADSDDE